MINEFRYGQTWKIWPSPLSLSLYSTFNSNSIDNQIKIDKKLPISCHNYFQFPLKI